MQRTGRWLLVAAVLALMGCTSTYDAGRTSSAQLCTVLRSTLATSGDRRGFSLEAELEGAARQPVDMPASLVAINLSFRTHERSYDRLGPYLPAIRFAAELVDLSARDLIGPSTLSARVLASAQAVDRTLASRACG